LDGPMAQQAGVIKKTGFGGCEVAGNLDDNQG
jgi:hypothetical protein